MSDNQPANWLKLTFPSKAANVSLARTTVAMFASQLDFTLEEIDELKLATSEAVSNAIIHGYPDGEGEIEVTCSLLPDALEVNVRDRGVGIEDIEQAKEPQFTTVPDEHVGLGFWFMQEYMDELRVRSAPGQGTEVWMLKRVRQQQAASADDAETG